MYYRRKGSKYNAKKVVIDGQTFDSKKEAHRWVELKALEKAGAIYGLKRQVKFVLLEAQREPDIVGPKGGRKPGKLIEHEAAYYADFVYATDEGIVVEDVKGLKTPEYVLKRKMMLKFYGIRIKEI